MSNINVNNLTPLLGSGSSVSVSGSLVVKNDVTIGGHLYIGDANTDSVTFSAEVSSSILPDANVTYDLGSSAKRWRTMYLNSLVIHHITASGNISASGTGTNGTGSFHHLYSNGNVHATGTGSFDQGVIANQSSSFTYVSMSGALKTAYHVTASRLQITKTAEIYGTASMGYISSSGDLTASGTGSFGGGIDSSTATGSFAYVQSEGDVSSSGTGSFMDLFVDDMVEIQGDVNLRGNISQSSTATASFGHLSASGDMTIVGSISSSGRVSASGGFETDSTGYFGSISSSGNFVTSGNISASRVSASAGFEADTLSTSSFGNISASGNISTSAHIHAVQYFTDSLIFATGDQASNTVKLGGATSVTRIHGAGIDVTGSISMSGALSMSGANANISTDQGSIYAGAAISSSEHIVGNLIQQHTAGVTNFAVDANGHVSASGKISSSQDLHGTHLTLATNGIPAFTVAANGNASSSGTLAGTALTLTTNGDTYASINALGTGSFLGGIHAGSLNTISSSFGYISASADISTSGDLYGETLIVGAGNSIINGNVKFNGGIVRPLKTITADTILDATDGVYADAGKTIVLNAAAGCSITLPAAGGTGNVYNFFVGTAITSNSYIIKVADSTDTLIGAVHMMDADDDSQTSITAKGTDDTLTMNGGTTGGAALGDTITFTDIATNKYVVQGNIIVPAGSNPADPFSATV